MPYVKPSEVLTWMLLDIEAQEPGKTVAEMITLLQTGYTHNCPKCDHTGRFVPNAALPDQKVVCDVCEGMGKTQYPVTETSLGTIYTEEVPSPESIAWRGANPACVLEEGENTGMKAWGDLEEYYIATDEPTGVIKPNAIDDPDYIAPVEDLATCPLP